MGPGPVLRDLLPREILHRLQHPLGSEEDLGLLQGSDCLASHTRPGPHAKAHQKDLPVLRHASELFRQLPKRQARLLPGAADHHHPGSRPAGGSQLLLKATGSPGGLGHQPAGPDLPEHGQVQFLGKGPCMAMSRLPSKPRARLWATDSSVERTRAYRRL